MMVSNGCKMYDCCNEFTYTVHPIMPFWRYYINVIKITKRYQIQSEPHNEVFTFYQILEMSYLLQNNWFFMILHQCDQNHEKNIKFNLNFIMYSLLFIKFW